MVNSLFQMRKIQSASVLSKMPQPKEATPELDLALRRYGFLTGFAARNDAEQAEMIRLRNQLLQAGIHTGWEELPQDVTDEEKVGTGAVGAPQIKCSLG